MQKSRHFGAVLLCSLAFQSCSAPKLRSVNPFEAPSASECQVRIVGSTLAQCHTFDNGLKLWVVEDHSSPTFAYYTFFKVGSRDEAPGYTGLAHLFEHMMFKGTKSVPNGTFDKILENAGVQGLNASTGQDYTNYVQELPKDKLDLIARLESDRMVNLIVDEQSLNTEREVVQNERRYRNENSADGLMEQELYSILFKVHPYHWPVIGYEEDLIRTKAEDAMKFYKAHYSPNRAIIIVSGDVTFAEAKRVVEKYYGSLPAVNIQEAIPQSEPPQKQARRKTLSLNIQAEKLVIGYPIPAYGHADHAALEILASLLSGGKSARLPRLLVESGLATEVDASAELNKDPGVFGFTANLQKGKKAIHAEKLILREIENIMHNPVSERELEQTRNQVAFSFYSLLGSNATKARFIGKSEVIGHDLQEAVKIIEQMQKVTASQVMNVAKQYLQAHKRNVIVGVPK